MTISRARRANATANELRNTRRILLHVSYQLAVLSVLRSTAAHGTTRLGCRRASYGSEGWGFESLRARKIMQVKTGNRLS